MKKLFCVKSKHMKKPHAYFPSKPEAKAHRDKLIAAGNGTAHVSPGPDHWRYKK
jgi:hypothetical protein